VLSSGLDWSSGQEIVIFVGVGRSNDNEFTFGPAFGYQGGTRVLGVTFIGGSETWTADTWVTDTEYTFTGYYKQATVANNDGIYRLWVDGGGYSHKLIYETTTAASYLNDTLNRYYLGLAYTDNTGGSAAYCAIDDVLVGTTEADVYAGSGGRNPVPMGFVLE
jgi:hypothetical protein